MSTEHTLSYGCCADIPEPLLHTGDYWDYPKWYLNYIRGIGDKKLPTPAKKFLVYLSDEKWKQQVGESGVGIGSLESCVELGLVKMGPFQKTEEGFIAEYKITDKGKSALNNKSLP
jgi:hypothetical protein